MSGQASRPSSDGWVNDAERYPDATRPPLQRALFRDRLPVLRVSGGLSPRGMRAFEAARHQLRELYREILKHPPAYATSDGDVIEFLCRGVEQTRRAFEQQAELERRVVDHARQFNTGHQGAA